MCVLSCHIASLSCSGTDADSYKNYSTNTHRAAHLRVLVGFTTKAHWMRSACMRCTEQLGSQQHTSRTLVQLITSCVSTSCSVHLLLAMLYVWRAWLRRDGLWWSWWACRIWHMRYCNTCPPDHNGTASAGTGHAHVQHVRADSNAQMRKSITRQRAVSLRELVPVSISREYTRPCFLHTPVARATMIPIQTRAQPIKNQVSSGTCRWPSKRSVGTTLPASAHMGSAGCSMCVDSTDVSQCDALQPPECPCY